MKLERKRVHTSHTMGGAVMLYHRHRCPICGAHFDCFERNCLMIDYQECPAEHEQLIEITNRKAS